MLSCFDKIEVYDQPVPRTKELIHCAFKFKAHGENRIVYEKYTITDNFATYPVTYISYYHKYAQEGFSHAHRNTNCGIFIFTTWKQKKLSDKMLPPLGIEPGPLIASDSKSSIILSTLTWHLLVRLRL